MEGQAKRKRRPDLFYACVGTGQVTKFQTIYEWQEKITHAQPTHDAAEVKALHAWAVQSPPDVPYIRMMSAYTGPEDHPTAAGANWFAGFHFEGSKVGRKMSEFDAMRDAGDLQVPYILIQGREDRMTPFVLAKAYFDNVQSEGKAFVPIEGGHYACFTNPLEFVGALNKRVLPLAF